MFAQETFVSHAIKFYPKKKEFRVAEFFFESLRSFYWII